MPKRRKPHRGAPRREEHHPPDLLVLDRFSEADVETWNRVSRELDELNQELYFATEPARRKRRDELIEALNVRPAQPFEFERWARIVEVCWADTPLSSAGSLRGFGGRFNVGIDVEASSIHPFPAFYVASCSETAYREKYQLARGTGSTGGLTPEELALNVSTATFFMSGRIERVLDVTDPFAIAPVCRVLKKIPLPAKAVRIARRLRISKGAVNMIKTPRGLQRAVMQQNWTTWPSQFGLPSPSQILAELAIAAGYEAIRYRSSKNADGRCLAIFSANLGSANTFVELADPSAPSVKHRRLDLESAEELTGWDTLPRMRHLRAL